MKIQGFQFLEFVICGYYNEQSGKKVTSTDKWLSMYQSKNSEDNQLLPMIIQTEV